MLRGKNEVLFGTKTMLQLIEEGNRLKEEEGLKEKTLVEESGIEEEYWRVKWMIRVYRRALEHDKSKETREYVKKRIRVIQESCDYTGLLTRRNEQRQLGGN